MQNSNASSQTIKCPHCDHQFLLDEALSKQIETHLRDSMEKEFADKNAFLLDRETKARKLIAQLQEKEKNIKEQVESQLELEKKNLLEIAEKKAAEEMNSKMKVLEEELEKKNKRQEELAAKELELLKRVNQVEDQKRSLELDLEKKFLEKSKLIEEQAALKVREEAELKLKEKDMQMLQLKKALDEAQRKTDQGSMQVQGDTLENDLKAALQAAYPVDIIEDVPTGIKGADLIQTVRNEFGQTAGIILWESKNTKNWSNDWIPKLRADQVEAKADISILATKTLPNDIEDSTNIEGIWVVHFKYALLVSRMLRSSLINISQVKQSLVGKDEKVEMLYRYLTGNQFKNRVENIVRSFESMQSGLEREKKFMQKEWAKKEKEIELVIANTTGMYGDLQGLLGQDTLSVPSLELEEGDDYDI